MTNPNARPPIISLGGINMDLVTFAHRLPHDGETVVGERFVTYPGGKGANQAVAVARLGWPSAMVGRVGDDMFGPQLIAQLQSAGVDARAVKIAPGVSSGIAVISVGESGQNRIVQVLGTNDTCGPDEFNAIAEMLPSAAALLLQLEVSVELSLRAARLAAQSKVPVILDPGPVRPVPDELLAGLSVITPNETEAEALVGYPVAGPESARSAAHDLLARGPAAAVIKLGAQGAFWSDGLSSGHVPPFSVTPIDTVAAGDAFNGALAIALSQGQPLPQAVRWACAAGAAAVTKIGAQDSMPTPSAVAAIAAQTAS